MSKASLAGQAYVANFIFTSCRSVCPSLTTKMVRLQRELHDLPVRFVSFSVDPGHDSPAVLADYARAWNPGEARWLLLATSASSLSDLIAGFHIAVQTSDAGPDPIVHSSILLLVDARGDVRGIYHPEDPADFRALMATARTLAGVTPEAAPRPALTGEALYREFSCHSCHDHEALAPPLGGLLGRRRTMDDGTELVADVAYVKESIMAPDARRLAGYPLHMPGSYELLSLEELDRLAAYVASLPSKPRVADQGVAIDPICGMEVRRSPDALEASLDGGEPVFFCSESCRAEFLEEGGPR